MLMFSGHLEMNLFVQPINLHYVTVLSMEAKIYMSMR